MTTPREDAIAALRLACHDMHLALWGGVDPTGHNVNPDGSGAGDCYKCDRLAEALEASPHWLAALGAEAGRGTDLCPDETACKTSGHAAYIVHRWLASPEAAEALAGALRSIPVPSTYEEWQARVDATYEDDAATILAVWREMREGKNV